MRIADAVSGRGNYLALPPLRLVADDGAARATNEILVLANRAPAVDAGPTQTIATLTTILAASVNDDGFPSNTLKLARSNARRPLACSFS